MIETDLVSQRHLRQHISYSDSWKMRMKEIIVTSVSILGL